MQYGKNGCFLRRSNDFALFMNRGDPMCAIKRNIER